MKQGSLYLEVDFAQEMKNGENICGDTFFSRKLHDPERTISVLSDGLGSGVKASILSSMTATMALKFMASDEDILHSAEIMMDALPICRTRKISYSTFTIVDSMLNGITRIIEMDNPPFILVRNGDLFSVPSRSMASEKWKDRYIAVSQFTPLPGDRIIIFSDGITQSGMGQANTPLGWRREGCQDHILKTISRNRNISARQLTRSIVNEAMKKDKTSSAGDDITCAAFYFRKPRRMAIFTGPPFKKDDDRDYARHLDEYEGSKVICGGTTTQIISRELGKVIKTDLSRREPGLPPRSYMEGVDLVTEGIITLTKVLKILEQGGNPPDKGTASRLVNMFMENDIINFYVGNKLNEAHQDPTLPVDIGIRRNIVKNISRLLEEKYLKEVFINYF